MAVEPTIRLTPLETAVDMPIGTCEDVPPPPECDPGLTPLEALEQAVLPALERSPCMVDFSGGRDSSTILAVATRVARREGLPLPIPSTNLFPDLPEAQESQWQELVIRHLGLEDWQRRAFANELELLGPYARSVMSRHGLVAPASAHTAIPALTDAAGGTSLTGLDGDGLFGTWASQRAWDALRARVRPTPRDVLRIAKAAAPVPVRRPWFRRRAALEVTWLLPEAKAKIDRAWADWWASEPAAWKRRVGWWTRSRLIVSVCDAFELLAQDAGTRVLHPLLDPAFQVALARAGGRSGFGDRTRTMHRLFAELLPPEVLSRPDKADFTFGYWGEETRNFAARWRGDGVPEGLVDKEALRATWTSDSPDMRSGLLLQAAWLATSGGGDLEQSFNCRLE